MSAFLAPAESLGALPSSGVVARRRVAPDFGGAQEAASVRQSLPDDTGGVAAALLLALPRTESGPVGRPDLDSQSEALPRHGLPWRTETLRTEELAPLPHPRRTRLAPARHSGGLISVPNRTS